MEDQEIIASMDDDTLKGLFNIVTQEDISIIKGPEAGLLMMTAKDSFDMDFHLGEILVTEAEVEHEGLRGFAIVMGNEPEKALLVASIDAILHGNNDRLKRQIDDLVSLQKERGREIHARDAALIAKTRVSFETMVKR